MITANVYNRVFFIRADQYGTAFAIDYDGKQYLVTAKHLIADVQKSIRLFFDRKWIELPATLIGLAIGEIDIAVFRVEMLLCKNEYELPATSKDIVIGQDIYFVGFPYKMWTDAGPALAGRPCPFIKKGTVSSAFVSNDGVHRIYIDAINNEGFSGGPIVFQPPGKMDFQVAGIVSKFKIEYEKVIDKDGEYTEMTVAYNTGFLIGFDISNAIDIIKKNPNGLPIPTHA